MDEDDPGVSLPLPPHLFEVLLALVEGPLHGYALIGEIERRTGGRVVLSTSSLYAAVHRLRRSGWVEDAPSAEASAGAPRRVYRLTPEGRRVLRLEALRLQDVAERARQGVLERGPRPEEAS
jgi:DNA-binding PadR family transcriptional regulator